MPSLYTHYIMPYHVMPYHVASYHALHHALCSLTDYGCLLLIFILINNKNELYYCLEIAFFIDLFMF
jgi:hypothetical protein